MSIQLHARTLTTKTALNQKRADKMIPGIIYGPKFANQAFFINEHDLLTEMKKGNFYHRILEYELNGKILKLMAQDLTSHSVTDKVIHIDFKHISNDCLIETKVSVHAINQDKCFDLQHGASIEFKKHFIAIKSTISHAPAVLEIDVTNMKTGHNVLAKDIVLSTHVALLSNPDDIVFGIIGKIRVL